MKKRLYIFTILSLTLLAACNRECKVIKEKYIDNKDKIVLIYPNCEDTTYYKRQYFHNNGQLSSEGYYKNGLGVGKFKRWTELGILIEEWELKEGKEHGAIHCWYPNGVKKREATLIKGVEHGIWKDWDINGNPQLEGTFNMGKKDGKWTLWEEDGSWKILTYKSDTLSGFTYEYSIDSSSIFHVIGQYENGKENGLWKWFDKDSILYQTATFTNGEYTGKAIKYYKNGRIKSEGKLVNKLYEGKVKYYDEKGYLSKIVMYEKGKKMDEKILN